MFKGFLCLKVYFLKWRDIFYMNNTKTYIYGDLVGS